MTATTIFERFDTLFRRRIGMSTSDGRDGSLEVRAITLTSGNRLRCAFDENNAHWYEVVFGDGESSPMRITRTSNISRGDTEILEAVLHENQA